MDKRYVEIADIGWFWGLAEADPDRTAVVSEFERAWTFGELRVRVNKISRALETMGIGADATVALAVSNCVDFIAVQLAAGQSGIYLLSANPKSTASELEYLFTDSGCAAVFADNGSVEEVLAAARAAGIADSRVILVDDPAPNAEPSAMVREVVSNLNLLTAAEPAGPPARRSAGRYLYYTSGTTGRPKGVHVPRTDQSPENDAGAWVAGFAGTFDLAPRDGVHLVTGPLYHRGPGLFALISLHIGHTLVLMRKFSPLEMLELVERYKVTMSHVVPTVFYRLLALDEAERARYKHDSLRHILHAAAPCPTHIKQAMIDWWGPVLWEYYGSTEGGGTVMRPELWESHLGSVGRPWPNARLRITDERRAELPIGEEGTIWISNGTSFEYRGDLAKTAASWDGDWFTVGDIGYLDDEGFLYLCDRRSDLIISGGVNVYPAEVEERLLQHPAVTDAAVFGVDDPNWGQSVVAVVELKLGEQVHAEDLREFCKQSLTAYKVPKQVIFAGTLPRTDIGKVRKNDLRDTYFPATGDKRA